MTATSCNSDFMQDSDFIEELAWKMTPDFGLLLLQYPYRPRPTGRLRNNLASALWHRRDCDFRVCFVTDW